MDTTNQAEWETLTPEEKRRALYDRQVAALKTFLEHGAITQAQHDKSLHDLTVKMGYQNGKDFFHIYVFSTNRDGVVFHNRFIIEGEVETSFLPANC